MAYEPPSPQTMKAAVSADIAEPGSLRSFIPLLCVFALAVGVTFLPTDIQPLEWIVRILVCGYYVIVGLAFLTAIWQIIVPLMTLAAKGWIGLAEHPSQFAGAVWASFARAPRLLLFVFLAGVLWLASRYREIEEDTLRRASANVHVHAERLKRDIAFVLDKQDTIEWGNVKGTVIWRVKIPSSNLIYYCEWDHGVNDFKKDDGVVFLHEPLDGEGGDGNNPAYIIGIHGGQKGKVTQVNAIEEESLLNAQGYPSN